MINLPKRSDPIYEEIESFEDYEFTNCIAYEMCLRSHYFNSIVDNLKSIIEKNKKFLSDIGTDKNQEILIEIFDKIDEEISNVDFSTDWTHSSNPYFLNLALAFSNSFYLSKNPYVEDTPQIINENNFYKRNCELYTCNDNGNIEVTNSFYYLDENANENDFFRNETSLKLILSRPEIEPSISMKLNIEINPNLPKNELIAYLSKIKDDYDNDNSIIKNPLELLGEKLEKAEDSPLINKKTNLIDKETVADMFFIYDAEKKGMKQNRIQRSIVEYYTEKYPDKFTPNMDYKTIKKYLDIAKDYIDNLKYRELITGVK